jgi:drug/metabolite transporter (DMT)-like permease
VVLYRRSRFPLRQKFWLFLFLGLFNTAVPFALISWAEKFIPSGIASILNSTMPLFILVIAPLVLPDERLTMKRISGLVLGFAGVVVLMSNQLGDGFGDYQLGIVAMLVAVLSYAVSTVFLRKTGGGLPVEIQTLGQMLFAWLIITPAALVIEPPFALPHQPLTWLALAWLGLLGTCVALLLFFDLIKQIGPTRASMNTYIFPIVGVVLGAAFLFEQPDWRLVVGGIMVILGVWVVNRK